MIEGKMIVAVLRKPCDSGSISTPVSQAILPHGLRAIPWLFKTGTHSEQLYVPGTVSMGSLVKLHPRPHKAAKLLSPFTCGSVYCGSESSNDLPKVTLPQCERHMKIIKFVFIEGLHWPGTKPCL